MGTHPSSNNRHKRQYLKKRYAHAREDAQLYGLIPTTPEGAMKSEVVDPATQEEQPLPQVVGEAVRKGWAVPEHKKPALVDELIGIVDNPEAPAKVKVTAFNALRMADHEQYERDHPEEAGKAKGSSKITVNNVNAQVGDVFSDIEHDTAVILGQTDSDIQADSVAESVDEKESMPPEEKSEAD